MTRASQRPQPDLAGIARSLVRVRAVVPEDALTAGILGVERVGSGIVIDQNGLVLTIGYLIAEATDVWLTPHQGAPLAAHPLAYDQATGFGLVLPLQPLRLPHLPLGTAHELMAGDEVHVLSYAGFAEPQEARVIARREFAGAWEYLLDEAIFTAPAHPHWSGSALIDGRGRLAGLGSLLVRETVAGVETNANMFVPIDLLAPIIGDLITRGRTARPPRPWLGLYAAEMDGSVYVTGVTAGGPAQRAGIREGDVLSQVARHDIGGLPEFYRRVWGCGSAGASIRLTVARRGARVEVTVNSVDRNDLLKRPQAH